MKKAGKGSMEKAVKRLAAGIMALSLAFSAVQVANAAGSPVTANEPAKQTNVKVDESSKGDASQVSTKKDGTAAVAAVKKTDATSVTIATSTTVDGVSYKVTELSAGLLKNAPNVTEVSVPKTVTKIEKGALQGKNLETVEFPITKVGSLTIEKGAFGTAKQTKNMTIKVSKEMTDKQFKKLKALLKKAGYKGKVKRSL